MPHAKTYNYCCGKDTGNDMIECSGTNGKNKCPGRGWFHYECINMDRNLADKIDVYICKECQTKTGLQTTYKENRVLTNIDLNSRTDRHNMDMNRNDEESDSVPMETETSYDSESDKESCEDTREILAVKAIRGHDLDDPSQRMMLRIEWQDYPEEKDWTWEYEDELTKCFTLVEEYRMKTPELSKTPTTLKPIGGADVQELGRYNEKNWPTLDEMKTKARQLLKHKKYETDLELIACTSTQLILPKKNSLIILFHAAHYYTMIWLKPENRILISDGANVIQNEERMKEIEDIIGHKIEAIRTDKKIKIDHCGAACIATLMEFSRMYKNGELNTETISFSTMYYDRAVATLHPEKSLPEAGRKDIKMVSRVLKCDKCNKFKTTKGRGALLSHQRQKCN